MHELWMALIVVFAGAALGTLFHAGLWWTTARLATLRQPGLWLLAGFLLRMVVLLGGFYLVAGTAWTRWLLCLLGFTLARLEVQWLARRPTHAP